MVCVQVVVVRVVVAAHEGVVGRHGPVEVGRAHRAAETQVLCGAVYAVAVAVVEPYAGKVDGHVDFLAGVGVVAVQPDFVVFAVDGFHPHFVDDDVSGQFVFVSAVYHQLRLCVERRGDAQRLWTGEVTNGFCGNGGGQQDHCYCQDEFFHDKAPFFCAVGVKPVAVLLLFRMGVFLFLVAVNDF